MATQPQVTEVKTNEPEQEVDPKDGQLKNVYRYQPRDRDGQFIGKPYKYFYTDHQDLAEQIRAGKEEGDRYIFEIKTGKRQIQGEPAKPVVEFKAAPESTEEADRKRREEFRRTAQEEFGADPEVVRETLKKASKLEEGIAAYHWALNKQAEGYFPCPENGRKIATWIKEKNLANIPANYDLAFEELKDSLIQAPPEQTADSTQQPPTRAEVKPQSTGMIPGQFAGTRQPNGHEKRPLTVERFREIDKLSRDKFMQLKRSNPNEFWAFVKMKESKAQPQQ
jgi:hypothetical protein